METRQIVGKHVANRNQPGNHSGDDAYSYADHGPVSVWCPRCDPAGYAKYSAKHKA